VGGLAKLKAETRETDIMQWAEVLADPTLRDLPYKIELNEYGKIVMTPASNRHGNIQSHIVRKLWTERNGGEVITECSMETDKGIKVADVAWCSAGFIQRHGMETPFSEAPEICVEVVSPSNSERELAEKRELYFARGAREVWIVSEDGGIRVFGHEGPRHEYWSGEKI
jgi:Uma2 family endonuclease